MVRSLVKRSNELLCQLIRQISFHIEWSSKNIDCGGVEVRPPPAGNRIVLKLFWDVAPLACENFATLCANGSSFGDPKGKAKPPPIGESGKPLTYRDSKVHRVVAGFVLQGGDFVFGNGSGGESVFGKKFKDERAGLLLKHDRRGLLSMGNSGKNSNSSQFFLTFAKASQCDGKHVIFGEIISGWEVLDAAEKLGTSNGEPLVPILITDCGIYTPLQTPGCGYWYDQPDPNSYSGVSSVFVAKPRVVAVAPKEAACQKFRSAFGSYVSFTSISTENRGDDETAISAEIAELLSSFCVDIVVVAPTCRDIIKKIAVPKDWEGIDASEIVLESKPFDALAELRVKSWFAKRTTWQLDSA